MAIKLQGYVFKDDGTAVSGATVQAYDSADGSTEGTATTTNSDGKWTYDDITADGLYDIKITSGGSIRYRKGADKATFEELYIRNDTAATQSPLYVANATNAASVKVLDLSNKRATASVADNDEIYMSFNMQDSAGNADEFARITAIATDVSNDTEDGALVFYVADSDNNGNLQEGFRITSTTGGTVSATTTSASQFNNTITVGVDDTGYDVKFFGATASAYMLWDESEDDLILGGAARLVVPDGQLVLGSTAVSSTPAELNLMDGGSSIGTTTVSDGHGIVMNHGGTMAQTTVQTLAAYLDDEITAMPNLVVDSGNYTNASVDFAHIQNVAANSILGRDANSSGVLSEIALATTQILIGDGTGFTAAALSGDVTMTNAGVVTIASNAVETAMINADAVTSAKIPDDAISEEHLADDVISAQTEITSGLAAADELLYSDGGVLKKVGLDNFVELSPQLATEDTIAVASDYVLFLDGGGTGNMNKESVADFVSAIAGSGLSASSGQLTASGGVSTGKAIALSMIFSN